MAIDVTMPALSPTMEKGNLTKWLVSVGDRIRAGDLLAEIETDKATMEVEADDDGIVAEILIAQGAEDVPVGAVLARLATQIGRGAEMQASPPKQSTSPKAAEPSWVSPTGSAPPALRPGTPLASSVVGGPEASPLALRIIAARSLNLDTVRGSGTAGRIVLRDLPPRPHATVPAPALAELDTLSQPAAFEADGPFERLKLTAMRRTIARRLTQSQQTVPHFYLVSHIRIGALASLRDELNEKLAGRDIKISLNDMMIKAFALALERTPDANVRFAGDSLLRFAAADIAVAVATDAGLVTPILRKAAAKPLSVISVEMKALAKRAREGQLSAHEYEGGTASLSNLGMFGVDQIVPIINPPQAVILGLGSVSPGVYADRGHVAVGDVMTATASFDHRAIDGAAGAILMQTLKGLLEDPFALML